MSLVKIQPKGQVTVPGAAAEYTPDQRRAIDARLKAAEKTPLHGAFKDGREIAAYLKTF
jgi:hypothetical protein